MNRAVTVPEQRSEQQTVAEVYLAWQYLADPESDRQTYQFLGVFSSPELAREKTAQMENSGWTLQVVEACLDPEEVC